MPSNKNIVFCVDKSMSSQVQQFHRELQKGISFGEVLEMVTEQIEIDCFSDDDSAIAREIVFIIAEVMKLPDDVKVRIAGDELPAELVALIYDNIEHEHVAEVIRRYRQVPYEIKHTKTYLRTALYNSIFEKNARIQNEVQKDMLYEKGESKCRGKNKRFRDH